MLGEFLLRLAIALPLVCGLAVVSLYAVKRGWVRLPALPGRRPLAAPGAQASSAPGSLAILAVKSLSPAVRIAVVRFSGRDFLLGVSSQGVVLLKDAAVESTGGTSTGVTSIRDIPARESAA